MANYSELIATINDQIKANGNQEITGPVLNAVLQAMVSALGDGYQFMGVATPKTNPGTPDGKVYYIATQEGIYANFGNLEINKGITIIYFKGSNWLSINILSIVQEVGGDEYGVISQSGFTKKIISILDNTELSLIFVEGYYIDATGAKKQDAAMCYTKPISVKEGDILSINTNANGVISIITTYADPEGSQLIGVKVVNSSVLKNYLFIAPQDCYVSFSGLNGQLSVNLFNNAFNDIIKSVMEFNSVKGDLLSLIDLPTQNKGYYINTAGTITSANGDANMCYTDLFQLSKGDCISVHVNPNGTIGVITVYNDSNRTKILSVITSNKVYENTVYLFTANENCYVSVSGKVSGMAVYKADGLLKEIADDSQNVPLEVGEIKESYKIPFVSGWGISNSTGEIIQATPNDKCTGMFYVKDVDTLLVTSTYARANVAFYNKSKNPISILTGTKIEEVVDVPHEAYYAAVADTGNQSLALIYGKNRLNILFNNFVERGVIFKGDVIANAITLDILNVNEENPPVIPTISTTWDFQKAYLKADGTLTYTDSEYQTRLVPIVGGARYKYTGGISGLSSIGFYAIDGAFITAYPASTFGNGLLSEIIFAAPKKASYATFNCYVSAIESFSVTCEEDYVGTEFPVSFNGSPKEIGINGELDTLVGNKLISISQSFNSNIGNSDGEKTIAKLLCNDNSELSIIYRHSSALDEKLPQKENTDREDDINYVEFPMGVFRHYLDIYVGDVLKTSIELDGSIRLPFIKIVPSITVRFMPSEDQSLSDFTELRLFITKGTNGYIDSIQIKNGDAEIYKLDVSEDMDIDTFYQTLKTELSSINEYSFDVNFGDLDGLSIKDIIATKDAGLPFVTLYSNNTKTSGTILYDNCPVFIEGINTDAFELEIIQNSGTIRIFLEGDFLFSISNKDIVKCLFGYEGLTVYNVEYDPQYNNADSRRPVIKGFTCHAQTTNPASLGTSYGIGNILYVNNVMSRQGWVNVSVKDVVNYMKNPKYPMPKKCWFIEVDDFGASSGVTDIFSNKEEYLRQMELMKMKNIHLCFACHLENDAELFLKIQDGTATEEEKNTLTTYMSNDMVYKVRGMMHSMDWIIALHSFIYPTQTVTASSFDDIIAAIRNSINWFERIYNVTPLSYVTHGTGNSSPYYRRILQMYGLLCVSQDNMTWYSNGRLQAFINRIGLYYRTGIADHAY